MGCVDRWMSLERVERACQVLPHPRGSYPIIRFPMTKYLFMISLFVSFLEVSIGSGGLPSNPQGGFLVLIVVTL